MTKITRRKCSQERRLARSSQDPCGTTWLGLAWQGSSAWAPLNLNEKPQSDRTFIIYISYLVFTALPAPSPPARKFWINIQLRCCADSQGYSCFPSTYQLKTQCGGPRPALWIPFMPHWERLRSQARRFNNAGPRVRSIDVDALIMWKYKEKKEDSIYYSCVGYLCVKMEPTLTYLYCILEHQWVLEVPVDRKETEASELQIIYHMFPEYMSGFKILITSWNILLYWVKALIRCTAETWLSNALKKLHSICCFWTRPNVSRFM